MSPATVCIFLVTIGVLLVSSASADELQYLNDCNGDCPFHPEATCRVICARVVGNEGEDCIERFFVGDEVVFCEN